MAAEVSVTITIEGRLASDVARLADKLEQSVDRVALDAISTVVSEDLAFLDSLDEAEAQIDRGEFYTQEQMEQWLEARRAVDRAA